MRWLVRQVRRRPGPRTKWRWFARRGGRLQPTAPQRLVALSTFRGPALAGERPPAVPAEQVTLLYTRRLFRRAGSRRNAMQRRRKGTHHGTTSRLRLRRRCRERRNPACTACMSATAGRRNLAQRPGSCSRPARSANRAGMSPAACVVQVGDDGHAETSRRRSARRCRSAAATARGFPARQPPRQRLDARHTISVSRVDELVARPASLGWRPTVLVASPRFRLAATSERLRSGARDACLG
jgi:hypothetical protein